ncbi:hypothetical protein SNEBB_000906 [Seison nebaliae]|nr:hypothetical protein SNEBB_000906 [Seison nebaliae]
MYGKSSNFLFFKREKEDKMPLKKRENVKFPPTRIKRIMKLDEEVGKVSASVPAVVSSALEQFVHSLISDSARVTLSKDARTMQTVHLAEVIQGTDHKSISAIIQSVQKKF